MLLTPFPFKRIKNFYFINCNYSFFQKKINNVSKTTNISYLYTSFSKKYYFVYLAARWSPRILSSLLGLPKMHLTQVITYVNWFFVKTQVNFVKNPWLVFLSIKCRPGVTNILKFSRYRHLKKHVNIKKWLSKNFIRLNKIT